MESAIFFDVDGTLIDSREDLAGAVNATRVELGLQPVPLETVTAAIGNGVRALVAGSIPEFKDSIDNIMALQMKNYELHLTDKSRLYTGVRETLQRIKQRGWRLGVVTNKPGDMARKVLGHFGIERLFDAIVGGGDTVKMKPDSEPLVKAAEMMRHRLNRNDIMVGDNWTDLDMARNAGIKSVFCRYGFGSLRESTYNYAVLRFNEILKICDELD